MSKSRKRKNRRARRAVNRSERIKPTPETVAKLKPHPLEELLALGREGGGIDADQWQCAEEIVEARDTVGLGLGFSSADMASLATLGLAAGAASYAEQPMSNRAEWLSAIWQAWAAELQRRWQVRRPFVVVDRIESRLPFAPGMAQALGAALDLWAKTRHDISRAVSPIRPNDA